MRALVRVVSVFALAVGAVVVGVASPAGAATGILSWELSGGRLIYHTAAGATNNVVLTPTTNSQGNFAIRIHDFGDTYGVRDGCDFVNNNEIICTPSVDGFSLIELRLGGGNDSADASLLVFPMQMQGESGDDTLIGSGARDIIEGDGGDDHIDGRAGDDDLFGNAGHDVIIGGPGFDNMKGGLNTDTIFADDNNVETVDCGDGLFDGKDTADMDTGAVADLDPGDTCEIEF
jgi:RTX calcium-binding nonapeptide repeat (4 copies)